MIQSGSIVLFQFPRPDLTTGKLRPALLLGRLPGPFDDWLICMISSQLKHKVAGFDEVIHSTDPDFPQTGLRATSLIRLGRLAVVDGSVLCGSIGEITFDRLQHLKNNLISWMSKS